jgi:septal ring factor EnvC (AmiA/AmiB activator)
MNGKKEDIFMLVFIASFLISVWFLCTGRNAVHDIRERAEPLRTELNNARTEQQKQSETLEKAERATGASRERIEDSKRFNKEITNTERENETIIAECRNILRAVRARGGTQD